MLEHEKNLFLFLSHFIESNEIELFPSAMKNGIFFVWDDFWRVFNAFMYVHLVYKNLNDEQKLQSYSSPFLFLPLKFLVYERTNEESKERCLNKIKPLS